MRRGRFGTAKALAGLRQRLETEEDAHVKVEIDEAMRKAEKSCAVVSD